MWRKAKKGWKRRQEVIGLNRKKAKEDLTDHVKRSTML